MKPKYKIGDKVKFNGDSEFDIGEVISIIITASDIKYTISSKEVDIVKKMLVDGSKTCLESELLLIKE